MRFLESSSIDVIKHEEEKEKAGSWQQASQFAPLSPGPLMLPAAVGDMEGPC